jgi:hypothetical protein
VTIRLRRSERSITRVLGGKNNRIALAAILMGTVAIVAASAQTGFLEGQEGTDAFDELVRPGVASYTEVQHSDSDTDSPGMTESYEPRLIVQDGRLVLTGMPPLPSIDPVTGPWETYERAIDIAPQLEAVAPVYVHEQAYERAIDGLGPLGPAQVYIPAETRPARVGG